VPITRILSPHAALWRDFGLNQSSFSSRPDLAIGFNQMAPGYICSVFLHCLRLSMPAAVLFWLVRALRVKLTDVQNDASS
jgi:hypothetical protein